MPLTIVPLAPVQGILNTGGGPASVSGAMARKHSVTKALRVADDAILICRGTRARNGQSSVISWLLDHMIGTT